MPETPWWLSLIIAWLPFVATLSVYLYALSVIRRILSTRDGRLIADVVQELANEAKRSNDERK